MSIKLRNIGEFVVQLNVPGTQATSANVVATAIVPFNGIIKAVWAVLGTAGVTGTQTTDVKKNGTTIVASGTLLSFTTAVTAATYGTLTTNPTLVSAGDILSVVTSGVHSGTAAKDLNLMIVIERLRGSGAPGAMITDGIGGDEVPA